MNTKELHEYAWNWFEYHAGQRLTAFRFFLIFLGALVVGFSTGLRDGNIFFISVVGWSGAFISIAFLTLEFRNEQLVDMGRKALLHLEQFDKSMKVHPKLQLLHIDSKRSVWLSHKCWFRAIYGMCILLFIIGAGYFTFVCTAS